MIGSFWNLCRACPSMPVDKLHSEYRSTYRWHEYTGNSRPEVVRKPPVSNQFASSADHFFSKSMEDERSAEGSINEPPLPRRKKNPELAYRTHEFLVGNDVPTSNFRSTENAITRARSDERGTPSRRSKSAGPPGIPNGKALDLSMEQNGDIKENGISSIQAGESNGIFRKTISKLSTEYRLQFVWPNVCKPNRNLIADKTDVPKKSVSMVAIRSTQTNAMPAVHKKRIGNEKEAAAHELEPLVNKAEEKQFLEKSNTIKTTRPRSQILEHEQLSTKKENFGFSEDVVDNKILANGVGPYNRQWYKEVIELRKKAGEYKCRGWGVNIDPEMHKKQKDLWDQVSKRSSLSALSLASSVHRPITKEEKEEANIRKTSPNKIISNGRIPGQAYLIDNKNLIDGPLLPQRLQTIRHHLERTTGPDIEDGALLPSPTREKLMPAIPKSKDDPYGSQRGSPKKSRHGSPQKGSPQKGSPKKTLKGRSQSAGPNAIDINESPKRQIRSVSTAPPAAKTQKKTPVSTPTTGERRPRPSTLSTTIQFRPKSSSLPRSDRAQSVPGKHQSKLMQNDTNLKSPVLKSQKVSKSRPKPTLANGLASAMAGQTALSKKAQIKSKAQDCIFSENDEEVRDKDCVKSISSMNNEEPFEHIVKSPPEPTRVKSPEQIIMRSPDPVNWTVPLDTGKIFTVTQNVKEGENFSRPQSEVKVLTPLEKPPPAPQSAPPELAEQAKMQTWKNEDITDGDNSGTLSSSEPSKETAIVDIKYDKPIPGSTLRCLDDPAFDSDPSLSSRNMATDVLEKARDRFDRFWGGNKEENV